MTDAPRPSSLQLARMCQHALEEKKAGDVRVLDVGGLSTITDYLVIATATSDPHLRAIRIELEKVLDGSKSLIVGMDTAPESGWTVVDAFDVMIHVLTPDRRETYGLEHLWKDAKDITTVPKETPAEAAGGAGKAASKAKPKSPKKVASRKKGSADGGKPTSARRTASGKSVAKAPSAKRVPAKSARKPQSPSS